MKPCKLMRLFTYGIPLADGELMGIPSAPLVTGNTRNIIWFEGRELIWPNIISFKSLPCETYL
jgi:hypothetical protein